MDDAVVGDRGCVDGVAAVGADLGSEEVVR